MGANWGEQKNNLLLNKIREPLPTEGAETLVQGVHTPLPPLLIEEGCNIQASSPREQQAKMEDPPPPQIHRRSASPPKKIIAAALFIDRREDLYPGSSEGANRLDNIKGEEQTLEMRK